MRLKNCTPLAALTMALAGYAASQQRTPVAQVAAGPAKAPHVFKAIDF
ncbi:hypothetical protein [Pseudomonas sp. N2-5-1-1]